MQQILTPAHTGRHYEMCNTSPYAGPDWSAFIFAQHPPIRRPGLVSIVRVRQTPAGLDWLACWEITSRKDKTILHKQEITEKTTRTATRNILRLTTNILTPAGLVGMLRVTTLPCRFGLVGMLKHTINGLLPARTGRHSEICNKPLTPVRTGRQIIPLTLRRS